MHVCVVMHRYDLWHCVCPFHILFIYLIPEDVLPRDSKAIGIICALFKPFLSRVILTREEEDDDDDDEGEDLAWGRGITRTFLFS